MNQSLTLAFLVAAGIGLVVQNTLMVRITQSSSTILIAMLLNSLVGIVLFVSILLLKQGVAGFSELAATVRWWTLIPGLLGSFFVFASISGYQNVGAATTIAVLVASQLIGGLVMDVLRSHGVPPRPGRPGVRRGDAGCRGLAGGATPVLRLQNRAAFGQLFLPRVHFFFMLLTVMRNRGTQTLLLGIAFFPAELCIIAQFNQQFVHMGNHALVDGGIHAGGYVV